jgi:hypothetical protein
MSYSLVSFAMTKVQNKYYEKVVARIKEGISLGKFHPDSRIIGWYWNSKTRIAAYCGKEEHDFGLVPSDFKSKKWAWCSGCGGRSAKESERKFHVACKKQGAVAVGVFRGSHTPCAVRCAKGHTRMRDPSNVISGHKCDWCYGKCADKNEERLRELFVQIGFTLLSPYVNSSTPMDVLCDKGHPIHPRANDMLNKHSRCITCDGSTREQGLANLMKVLNARNEVLLGEYVNNHTRVEIRCARNHEYMGMPNNITSTGDGCIKCQESKLERAARLVLEKHGIAFDQEYHDPLAPRLEFDFRFWYQGKERRLELDGSPHFTNACFYGRSEEEFRRSQERDRTKDLICWKRAVQMIRIPYTCLEDMEYYLFASLEQDVALIAWDTKLYNPIYEGDEDPSTD